MSRWRSPFIWFILTLIFTAGLTALGPRDSALGDNVRIVYLHGAWELTAEIALGCAAATGLIGLVFRRTITMSWWHRWSAALGLTGLFFWVTNLPLSLWAMQANWNGLFLSEPRFRVAVIFSIAGVLLQLGLTLLSRPPITSLFNVFFFVALRIILMQTAYVMHPPPSPIFDSGSLSLQLYFIVVILLTVSSAYFMSRWWLQRQQ
jgi:hypothetical protein